MRKYKIVKMNTTNGVVYKIFWHDGYDWKSDTLSGYYKTKKGAERKITQYKKAGSFII